jgi:hypothetical protein
MCALGRRIWNRTRGRHTISCLGLGLEELNVGPKNLFLDL